LQDHAISVFNLPIHSRVRHSYPIHADVVIIAKAKKFVASELDTIIGDDTVWHSKVMDDVCEEEDCLFRLNLGDQSSLNPF
jgi:hypothetical protein